MDGKAVSVITLANMKPSRRLIRRARDIIG
jgi:hypothetical protein